MEILHWLLFCATELFLCLAPGPAVIYVMTQGVKSGYQASLHANAGIISGNIIYFVISATGVGALLMTSHDLFTVIRWVGAAYLIYLGFKTFFGKSELAPDALPISHSGFEIYKTGLIIQLSNPKNLIYFIAILPQFLSPESSLATQILILGLSSVVIEVAVLMLYGNFGNYMRTQFNQRINKASLFKYVDRIAGGALVGIGASIASIQK